MKLQLPEIVSVGIYNAQVANKRKTITENRKTTMFEIELPIENGGQSYIDKETQKITPNLLICAKPGQVRHTKLPFKCYYIHMIVTKGSLYDTLMSIPNYMIVQDPSEFARLFEQLYESHHSGIPENELLTHSLVLSLVYKLKQCTPLPASDYSVKHNHHVVIEEAIRYIRENLSSELSLALLAEQANFSPIYFHKLFRFFSAEVEYFIGKIPIRTGHRIVVIEQSFPFQLECSEKCGKIDSDAELLPVRIVFTDFFQNKAAVFGLL